MRLHCFGTGSGTEPHKSARHVAFALEVSGFLYWFDAGEGCSYTAAMMGLDLLKIKAIFISHGHMDHVGGLANLLWNIRKYTLVEKRLPDDCIIKLLMANMRTYKGLRLMLAESEGAFECDFKIDVSELFDGIVYEDNQVRVEAHHNKHVSEVSPWLSYSFKIMAENKRIVYSGDIKELSDLDHFLVVGCDVLLIETGHFKVFDIINYIEEKRYKVEKIYYIHNGLEILNNRQKVLEKLIKTEKNIKILEDKEQIYL